MSSNRNNTRESVLVKRNVFAQMAGVVPSTVTKACQSGELKVHRSGLLDINEPANSIYIREHRDQYPFDSPVAEVKPWDAILDQDKYFKMLFSVKKGNQYFPIMAMEFEPHIDTPTREIYYPIGEDMLEIHFKDNAPWRFKIAGKFQQAHCVLVFK